MAKVAGRLVILKRQFSTNVSSIKSQIPYGVTQKIIKTLFIHTPEDWYNVPYSYLKIVKGKDVADAVKQYPTVEALAQAIHPEHQWDQSKFASFKGKFGPQTFLERVVRSLFPNEQIQRNAREATGIIGSKYNYLEIDIFIPSLNLGFEYQDPHHYFHSTYGLHTLSEYQSRDAEKHKQAKEKGLTIINVPFWWDWNPDSLLATIKHKRPDLLKQLQTDTPPINEELPQKVLDKWNFDIPELGLPMLALYMPQVRSFDPENWWIFEKYDGMRAVWNSLRRQMYSRWGTPLNIPNYIRDSLPEFWLDGEIWFGREKNTRYLALKINERTSTTRVAWDRFVYMVFDAPQPNLLTSPYSDRYAFLEKMIPPENIFVKLAPYHICIGRDHLETISQEGEGVIVRHPDAVYINGYSRYIFKHRGYNDAEALVLEKKPYGNAYICRIHKLHLYHNTRGNKETDGEANDKEEPEENGEEEEEEEDTENTTKKKSPYYDLEMTVDESKFGGDTSEIAVGKFVSFYYAGELSGRGPPLNPKIYGVRNDVTNWEQLLHDKKPKLHQRIWKPTAPVNEWTPQNQRNFLDKFAKERGFDPLVASNWYKIEAIEIGAKIGRGLLSKYNDSLIKCLVAVYPEVDFDLQKFKVVPSGYWQNKENKKKFFDQFAKDRGFDPLSAEDWYKIELREVLEKKGGGVLRTYKNSLSAALRDIYPTINLEKHGFSRAPVNYWNSQENQKLYLLDYSKTNKFDALQPKNWYTILPKQIHADKGLVAISRAHGSSFARALLTLFPDLPWDISKFSVQKWETKEEIRLFFDNFAKRWKFDPKVPDNWYSVTRASVVEAKGGRVLAQYQQSLVAALMDIYPEIGLQREKFKFATRSFLKLFQGLAKLKQFDAKDKRKWYNVTADDISQYPGGGEIKTIFPTYAAALLHNFPQIGLDPSKLDPSLHQPLNVKE